MKKKKNTKNKVQMTTSNSDINVPNTISSLKVKLILIFTFLIFLLLICRLVYLQLIDGASLQTSATSQQTLTETISAKRGSIYDSNGNTLAISYDTDKIYVNPSDIDDSNKELVAQGLASILELDYNELLDKLKNNTSRFLVASDVVQDKVTELTNWKDKLKFKTGISLEDSTNRSYPYGSLASTVLGFTGTDNQGLSGIFVRYVDKHL